MSGIRVLIASDLQLFCEGLRVLLAAVPELEVVGSVARAVDLPDTIPTLHPDVVVLDQAMPGAQELVRGLSGMPQACRVVALGVPDQDEQLLAWAEAGAAGFVPRDGSVESLCQTIASAARGELTCSARVAGTLLKRLQRRVLDLPAGSVRHPLTEREVEIFRLVDSGLSNKEIATRLGIEVATVKNHVHNVLEKLQVHRRAEAVGRLRGRDPRRPTPMPFHLRNPTSPFP